MGGLTFQNDWKIVCLFILLKEFAALVHEGFYSSHIHVKETALSINKSLISRQDNTDQKFYNTFMSSVTQPHIVPGLCDFLSMFFSMQLQLCPLKLSNFRKKDKNSP